MRANHAFHFTIYRLSGADTLLALVESVWLQFGPFMRTVYGRYGTSNLDDQHRRAIAAIAANNEKELRDAIDEDIRQGFQFIRDEVMSD